MTTNENGSRTPRIARMLPSPSNLLTTNHLNEIEFLNTTRVLEARIHANSEGTDRQQELRFLVDHFKSWRSVLGLASRTRIGIEDERSFAAWLLVERINELPAILSHEHFPQLSGKICRTRKKRVIAIAALRHHVLAANQLAYSRRVTPHIPG